MLPSHAVTSNDSESERLIRIQNVTLLPISSVEPYAPSLMRYLFGTLNIVLKNYFVSFTPTFRTEALILVNFLSVKPHISLSQELQQVQVLVGQIEHEEPLPRDVEHMNPHKVVEDPPCGGGLDALAFLVRKGSLVLLERVADAIL